MASVKSRMVRMDEDVIALVKKCRESILEAHERGQRDLPLTRDGHLSMDETVRILAEHYLNHLERAKKNGKKSKN